MAFWSGGIDVEARMMIKNHLEDCNRERAESRRREDQFRSEYAADMSELKTQLTAGFSTLHGRVNSVKNWSTGVMITVAGALIIGLLTVLLTVLTNGLPWQRPAAIPVDQLQDILKAVPQK